MKNVLIAPMKASLVLFSLVALMACADEDVGVPCNTSGETGEGGTTVTTNSLECVSRLCLAMENATQPQCTKICESDDDCPESGPTCPNDEPYVCVVATSVGGLRCCKMCVCREFLTQEQREGKIPPVCETISPNCPSL